MKEVKSTHTGSYGFIIKDDKIALIKKARGGYTGLLDLPGGGIEHNETPVEALHRELQEEAGVTVTHEELITATSRTPLSSMMFISEIILTSRTASLRAMEQSRLTLIIRKRMVSRL